MTHPASCTDPTCRLSYAAHLRTINVSPSAMPSRSWNRTPGQPDEPIEKTNARQKRWDADLPAFKRLHEAGVETRIDGAAKVERELGG